MMNFAFAIDEVALIIASLRQTQELCRKVAAADPKRVQAAAQANQIDTIVAKLLASDERRA